ncbi:MAG: DEAD/DEAH box helicase family protein [Ignisphaera sp.]
MSIEKYLVLNKYLLSLFGVNNFRDLQQKLKDTSTGIDSDGRSYFVNVLRSLENLKIPKDVLLKYDENIQSYVRKINYKREPVSLKYFQYLAVLFTEIVLDNLKNRKQEFLYELNKFLEKYKEEQGIEIIDSFSEYDLKKLAFWMATGSGKTLIMHINYYQFLDNYKLFSPDNIILITPNEGLSKQHFEELQKSGIPCRLYTSSLSGGLRSNDEVLVIEITKIVEEKKGGGVTLPVDVFEGRNLVFVDEGHKGQAGNKEELRWKKRRDKLAKNGFTFEYSATFGQILDIPSKKQKEERKPVAEIFEEYAKAIIFDYSYKYFYLDGYGKDFSILNVRQTRISDRDFQELMFVANLLSFYEQILVYEDNIHLAREYNIEKPLWIFVGTTVTGRGEESDVIQIVEFIDRVIRDEEWLSSLVTKILNGNSGLVDEDGRDVFGSRFKYLRKRGIDFDDLYRRVFGGRGSLCIWELKNAEGEFGLKVSENDYFGVINIGDVSGFKKQLDKKGIVVEQDAISGSLFDDIKKEGSKVNLLIGSKKFIEGWDTWRVSSMGLLNIGKGQGPQIIQLFGRGIRLKGKNMSLKRSEGNSPIRLLETLNIYGIKADYLNKFLEAIRREEVEFEEIKIPVKLQHEDKWGTLYTLSKSKDKKFEEEEVLNFEIDEKIYCTINLIPKLSVYQASERREEGIELGQVGGISEGLVLQRELVDLLDWERIWHEVCEFKIARGYWNLVLERDKLKSLLLSDRYKIITFPELLEPKNANDLRRLEEIALLVIKKYLDLFYRKHAKDFETKNLCYRKVEQLTLPFVSENNERYYVVYIKKRDEKGRVVNKDLIDKIKKLTRNLNKLFKQETDELPRIYLDSHLYLPILIKSEKIDKVFPPALVESEEKFVKNLRSYLENNKYRFSDFEIYLLRNYPVSGLGFQLQWHKFYPDFIMWVKYKDKQIIVFIDPKGLEHTKTLNDEKIQFAKEIKNIEKKLSNSNIILESFILSITSYDKLIEGMVNPPSKEEYEANHVLFLEDEDIWCEKLFRYITRALRGI